MRPCPRKRYTALDSRHILSEYYQRRRYEEALPYPTCIQRWAPQTLTWLLIGVVPSSILVLIGGLLILKGSYPQLFR